MKKLYYNIYENVTDKQFFWIEDKLKKLQYKMKVILISSGWKLPSPIGTKDGLTLNFTKKDESFRGSMGISFEDKPGKLTFKFGVIKYFDENNWRYSLTHLYVDGQELNTFETNISEITQEALQLYNSWNREDILKNGEKYTLEAPNF